MGRPRLQMEGKKRMSRIPEFTELMNSISLIHDKKNRDYASAENPFSNFERSAELMSWFKDENDKAFVSLIGTKLARLAELLQEDKVPNNESIDDSFLDLSTYCILWGAYRKRFPKNKLLPG